MKVLCSAVRASPFPWPTQVSTGVGMWWHMRPPTHCKTLPASPSPTNTPYLNKKTPRAPCSSVLTSRLPCEEGRRRNQHRHPGAANAPQLRTERVAPGHSPLHNHTQLFLVSRKQRNNFTLLGFFKDTWQENEENTQYAANFSAKQDFQQLLHVSPKQLRALVSK